MMNTYSEIRLNNKRYFYSLFNAPLLFFVLTFFLPMTATAERIVVEQYHALSVKPGWKCSGDSTASTPSHEMSNNYFSRYLVYDGTNCVQPPACDAWDCPKLAVTKEWDSFKSDTRNRKRLSEAKNLLEKNLRSTFVARQASYNSLPAGKATLVHEGNTILTGSLDEILSKSVKGDRIELSKGAFNGFGVSNAAENLVFIGQGPETVLSGIHSLPANGNWFQDMTVVNPTFIEPWGNKDLTNYFVRVQFDLFADYRFIDGHQLNAIVTIFGSFGQVIPENIHFLPYRAFGTHVSTVNEYGEMFDYYALPISLSGSPLQQWMASHTPKSKPMAIKKALKASPWKSLPDIDEASAAAISAWSAPSDIDSGIAISMSAIRSWLTPTTANTSEDPLLIAVKADINAKRPVSALLRILRSQSADFSVADQLTSLKADARKTIANTYGCKININPDVTKRGPQNSTLRWDNVPYDSTLEQLGNVDLSQLYMQQVPVARLGGNNVVEGCSFITTLGVDAWMYEKTVSQARIEKTEWFLSAQGMAKRSAAIEASLSNLQQSFEAAASSIESTWKNFDAYRTRVVSTQSGEKYLQSYTGDRNANNRKGFDELEKLRQQANNQASPGTAGDYYPITTYAVDAKQKFRHYIDFAISGNIESKQIWSSGQRQIDKTWDGSSCKDTFIDNGDEIRTRGTDCFLSSGYKGIEQLRSEVSSAFNTFLNQHAIKHIDSLLDQQAKSSLPEDQAEAVLVNILMKHPLKTTDTALLQSLFGNDISPENAEKALLAASR